MTRDSLPHRRERVSGQLLEHFVETMNRFLGKGPRHGGIVARRAFNSIDVEEKSGTGHDRLYEDWRRPADERRHTEKIAGTDVAHRNLTAVAGVHVDTK